MASCDVLDVAKANENDCPKNRREAMALFLSRSQANTNSGPSTELRPPIAGHTTNRRQKRESRISQHIQLFETRGGTTPTTTTVPVTSFSRPSSSMSASMTMAASSSEGILENVEIPQEPLYMNVETKPEFPVGRSCKDITATRKKPVPNPRKSLLQPVVENMVSSQEDIGQDLRSSQSRPPPLSPRPIRPQPFDPQEFPVPDGSPLRGSSSVDINKRRITVSDLPHIVLTSPPPLPETGPPIRKLISQSVCSRSDTLPSNHDILQRNSVVTHDVPRTPVRDGNFLRHLNEITDLQRKWQTLPANTPRPIFGPTPPSPTFSSLLGFSTDDNALHLSRRPLPRPPNLPNEDDESYSDTAGEPIYQELADVSYNISVIRQPTVLTRQAVLRKNRRAAGHFRSLRGPPVEFEVAPRAASFTTADLIGSAAGDAASASGTQIRPYSSSCSSMSLTESDSGVSLELESLRDDMSLHFVRPGLQWSPTEFQKAVEKMQGLQGRTESLTTGDSRNARVKTTPKMLHDKTRRHTLPLSLLSATVSDDDEDDSHLCSTDKMISELTAYYPARGLWYQQPTVIESDVLQQLSDDGRKIQEAVYEIIRTEATYLRSLTILISVFKNAPEFVSASKTGASDLTLAAVSHHEEQNLFLNIVEVRNTSLILLRDMHERCLKHEAVTGLPTMPDFSDILEYFATNHAKVYVKYCSDQLFQEKTLNGLKERKRFQEVIRRLEGQKVCEQLDFRSYLMLPMQRITRLPLLLSAVVKRYQVDSAEYTGYNKALDAMNKVVRECDEGARRANCIEELVRINALFHWLDPSVKKVPIISAARSLLKRGFVDVIQIEHKFLPRRTFHKKSMHLLLFNDLFMLTKSKSGSEDALVVVDYCQRNLLDCLPVTAAERDDLFAHTSISAVVTPDTFRGVKLVLLRNSAQKTVEFFLVMTLESDYMRWMNVFNPSDTMQGDEKIYEIWDCPQYEVISNYTANENDELNVAIGDIVDVYRKSTDGWIEGRRMADGHRGWLPIGVAKEIMTEHARARHLKERNRLLAASAEMMKERTQK